MQLNLKTFYEIHCRSGVVCTGGSTDFLAVILMARDAKARMQALLPSSRFRVQLRNPNGYRVAAVDVKSALRALENPAIKAFVTKRMAAVATRSAAAADSAFSAVAEGDGFCQAGVVAPPDSLTGETRSEIWKGKWAGRFSVKSGASNGL